MTFIFISYRRAESITITGRIDDHLRNSYGDELVFRDIDNIPFGVDFREYLQNEVRLCDICLVIIGQQWLNIEDDSGQRRLENPDDYVRIEVEAALEQGKVVIPVLVHNAQMPKPPQLPKSIRQLAYQNAAVIRDDPDFRHDIKKLMHGKIGINIYFKSRNMTPLDIISTLPKPFEWCEIPDKTIGIKTHVSAFSISKYPITNAQFQLFLDDQDGYKERRWWNYSEEALLWKSQNLIPATSKFKGDTRPREMVSWYEAKAFCQWLSHKSKENITLPTHAQRVWAIQGANNRTYPWGNDFDNHKCNTREFWLKATTSVDKYPNGATEHGALDMIGNVWEWSQIIDPTSQNSQVIVSGGGYYSRRRHTMTNNFRTQLPDYRASDVGFRICKLHHLSSFIYSQL